MNNMSTHYAKLVCLLVAIVLLIAAGCRERMYEQAGVVKFENIRLKYKNHQAPSSDGAVFNATYDPRQRLLKYELLWNSPAVLKAQFQGPALTKQHHNPNIYIFTDGKAQTAHQYSGTAHLTATQETELLSGNWSVCLFTEKNEPLSGQLIAMR